MRRGAYKKEKRCFLLRKIFLRQARYFRINIKAWLEGSFFFEFVIHVDTTRREIDTAGVTSTPVQDLL